jgi:hypothetical protein
MYKEEPNPLTESPMLAMKWFKTLTAPKDYKILEGRNIFVPLVSSFVIFYIVKFYGFNKY